MCSVGRVASVFLGLAAIFAAIHVGLGVASFVSPKWIEIRVTNTLRQDQLVFRSRSRGLFQECETQGSHDCWDVYNVNGTSANDREMTVINLHRIVPIMLCVAAGITLIVFLIIPITLCICRGKGKASGSNVLPAVIAVYAIITVLAGLLMFVGVVLFTNMQDKEVYIQSPRLPTARSALPEINRWNSKEKEGMAYYLALSAALVGQLGGVSLLLASRWL